MLQSSCGGARTPACRPVVMQSHLASLELATQGPPSLAAALVPAQLTTGSLDAARFPFAASGTAPVANPAARGRCSLARQKGVDFAQRSAADEEVADLAGLPWRTLLVVFPHSSDSSALHSRLAVQSESALPCELLDLSLRCASVPSSVSSVRSSPPSPPAYPT